MDASPGDLACLAAQSRDLANSIGDRAGDLGPDDAGLALSEQVVLLVNDEQTGRT